jgi:hypothetical protein
VDDATESAARKANQVIESIAQETGVAPDDVRKVVSRLGLETAIANRMNVQVDQIRISALPSPPI